MHVEKWTKEFDIMLMSQQGSRGCLHINVSVAPQCLADTQQLTMISVRLNSLLSLNDLCLLFGNHTDAV